MAHAHELLVTVEENMLQGGAGSAVNEVLAEQGTDVRVLNLGIPDEFIGHGDHQQQLADCGLDTAGIIRAIRGALKTSRLAAPASAIPGKLLSG